MLRNQFCRWPATARAAHLRGRRLSMEVLESRVVLGAGPLVISEFMAINSKTIRDRDGDHSDWIEVHNIADTAVNLDGWFLTDDPKDLRKWQFPAIVLPADGYHIVFASNKDRRDPQSELHTNFALDADGEYLALVRPDGLSVVHEYAPQFPKQRSDVSYGVTQNTTPFLVPEGGRLVYHVPGATDAAMGCNWTSPDFDDSAWEVYAQSPRILITEVGTGTPDYVEIQNISANVVDTSGWSVLVNDATAYDINAVHATVWDLPSFMAASQILYGTDDPGNNYWGSDISWQTTGKGWVMLVDDQGAVADFVVWGYRDSQLASLQVQVRGHWVTASGLWNAAPNPINNGAKKTLQRSGMADHDHAGDWAFREPHSMGLPNQGLQTPMSVQVATGIGFDTTASQELGGLLNADIQNSMQAINASLWMRIPFQVESLAAEDRLVLWMKYNDGFVAYLNGQEVARRNAPTSLAWDSAATAARAVGESLIFEEIDLTVFRDALRTGTNILAIQGLNSSATDANFLILPELVASGIRYFPAPTLGAANGDGVLGYVGDTKFSVDRGFFDSPFQVEITTATAGATVRYTTNGSAPTLTNGSDYLAPIPINRTTTLRATAFKTGYEPTSADAQTYIFLNDVISQSGAGLPVSWGATTADYEMDPEVIGLNNLFHNEYRNTIRSDLQSLPVVSLAMNFDDMFGASRGIYANPDGRGPTWERPVSVEYFDPASGERFQINAGVRIEGNIVRWVGAPKRSLRLYFDPRYGSGDLRFPLFPASDVDRFDKIDLRAIYNDSWLQEPHPVVTADTGQFVRDQFLRELYRDMGHLQAYSKHVHLYINGMYWGLYQASERPDAAFAAEHLGGSRDDYDVIKHIKGGGAELVDGNWIAWNQMMALADGGLSNDAQYEAICNLLDIDAFIDYMLVNTYTGNYDWPHNNWYATRNRLQTGSKFQFYIWDAELIFLKDLNIDKLANDVAGPGHLFVKLQANARFRARFSDHVHKYLFNDGLLQPEKMAARYRELLTQVEDAVVAESARWGDVRRAFPYTKADWTAESNRILNDYIPRRRAIFLAQLRGRKLYPTIDAPAFGVNGSYQHGGEVDPGDRLTMTAPQGEIYYTLDGSDPKLATGEISPNAMLYTGTPAILASSVLLRARSRVGSEWSALNEAQFFLSAPASAENLIVTELNYNPLPPVAAELAVDASLQNDDFEYLELANIGNSAIDLTGVGFVAGITFDFTNSTITGIDPGQHVLVVRNLVGFQARYGAERVKRVAGQYAGKLDNNGERLKLVDAQGQPILEFAYDDSGPWPGRADGKGFSLELIDLSVVPLPEPARTNYLEDGSHWRSSSEYGGSPGWVGQGPLSDVVINEVLTHSLVPQTDAIELYNTTAQPIDIGGWYLSDSSAKYDKYRIPAGTLLPAHGYLVLTEADFRRPGDPNGFGLDGAHGEEVWLVRCNVAGKLTTLADRVEFGAARLGESLGRWPNGSGELYPMRWPTLNPTQGENSGPRIGPVILSEVHYRPPGAAADNLEFVELYNPTPATVDLTGWRLAGGIDFNFPAGTLLASRGVLVVVSFDPSDVAKRTAFRTTYGLDSSVVLLGGYQGQLSDSGETVRLERPDGPPSDEPDFVPPVLEDEVDYSASWYAATSGEGQSLTRQGLATWGHEQSSWSAADPTPGHVALGARVVGRYVFYNDSAFDAYDAAAGAGDDAAIAPDKRALLPGQTASFANYTSYSQGINGLMIDIERLGDGESLSTSDFAFRIGNGDAVSTWALPPAPASVTVRSRAGVGGSDRVTLIWPEGSIRNTWLQIQVLATAATGLTETDGFCFGNLVGETGDSPDEATVNVADLLAVRDHLRTFLDPATINFAYDFNRDRRVNAIDMLLARNYLGGPGRALKLMAGCLERD